MSSNSFLTSLSPSNSRLSVVSFVLWLLILCFAVPLCSVSIFGFLCHIFQVRLPIRFWHPYHPVIVTIHILQLQFAVPRPSGLRILPPFYVCFILVTYSNKSSNLFLTSLSPGDSYNTYRIVCFRSLSRGNSDNVICIVCSKSLSPSNSDNPYLSYNCILVLSNYHQVILTTFVSTNSTYALCSCALLLKP